MLSEEEIEKYLKEARANNLELNRSDISFLSTFFTKIIKQTKDEYKNK
jgi:hypothetical protein